MPHFHATIIEPLLPIPISPSPSRSMSFSTASVGNCPRHPSQSPSTSVCFSRLHHRNRPFRSRPHQPTRRMADFRISPLKRTDRSPPQAAVGRAEFDEFYGQGLAPPPATQPAKAPEGVSRLTVRPARAPGPRGRLRTCSRIRTGKPAGGTATPFAGGTEGPGPALLAAAFQGREWEGISWPREKMRCRNRHARGPAGGMGRNVSGGHLERNVRYNLLDNDVPLTSSVTVPII